MALETIVQKALSGSAEQGWAVFHYNRKYALLQLFYRILYLLFSSAMTVLFVLAFLKRDKYEFVAFAIITGLISITLLIGIFLLVREILSSKQSMIVLTMDLLVKHHKNRSDQYLYSNITDLIATNLHLSNFPAIARRGNQYIDFRDKNTGLRINLTKNSYFGEPGEIYSLLKNRIEVMHTDYVTNFHS